MKIQTFICLASIILIWSCSEENIAPGQYNQDPINLEELNKYKPDKSNISEVYYSFQDEIDKSVNSIKSTINPIDRTVDEAVWLLESTTNTTNGFTNDKIIEPEEVVTEFILPYENVDENGIPIIPGDAIVDQYNTIQNSIDEDSANNIGFWCTRLEITEIDQSDVTVEMTTVEGDEDSYSKGLLIPYPPGTTIQPFPSNYTTYAGSVGDGMKWAELDFWRKYSSGERTHFISGTVVTYVGYSVHSAYGGAPMLWGEGSPDAYVLNASEANTYMYNTKMVLDNNNPHVNNPDLYIGYYHIYSPKHLPGSYNPAGHISQVVWFEHSLNIWIYEVDYIGIPDN